MIEHPEIRTTSVYIAVFEDMHHSYVLFIMPFMTMASGQDPFTVGTKLMWHQDVLRPHVKTLI